MSVAVGARPLLLASRLQSENAGCRIGGGVDFGGPGGRHGLQQNITHEYSSKFPASVFSTKRSLKIPENNTRKSAKNKNVPLHLGGRCQVAAAYSSADQVDYTLLTAGLVQLIQHAEWVYVCYQAEYSLVGVVLVHGGKL